MSELATLLPLPETGLCTTERQKTIRCDSAPAYGNLTKPPAGASEVVIRGNDERVIAEELAVEVVTLGPPQAYKKSSRGR